MALTGHCFGTGPDQATPGIARHARATIASNPQWAAASMVVRHFGPSYQPWLGLVKIGADGRAIKNDEDYETVHHLVKDSEKVDLHRAVGFQAALDALDKNTFDLIISDCLFDGRDDAELLQLLARYGKKVPVVVITGAGDDTIATDILRSSACEYLFKEQLSKKILFNVINKTLKRAHPQAEPIPIPK